MSAEYNTNITGGGVRKICMPLLFFYVEKVFQEILMKLFPAGQNAARVYMAYERLL